MSDRRRREFLTLLGGAAAWPLTARAQQREPMRRVGVLMTLSADDVIGQTRVAALLQGLQQAGWEVGRNLRIELRSSGANPEDIRKQAGELVALAPDVIVANGSAAAGPLLEATRSVPIVFVCLTRWARGMSTVWRDLAAMLPASPHSNTASAENGWNCSRRSGRA